MKKSNNPVIDPFFDDQRCIDRLYKEWKEHDGLLIAFDFDNTVFDFYNRGYSYDRVIDLLRECKELGCTLILFTCCDESKYEKMVSYCAQNGIPPDYINENPEYIPFCGRKCYYNIMLDDRAGLLQSYNVLLKTVQKVRKENEISTYHQQLA